MNTNLIVTGVLVIMIVIYITTKKIFKIFQKFSCGDKLKKHGAFHLKSFTYMFFALILWNIYSIVFFKGNIMTITILPTLYLIYKWKVFYDEYKTRTLSYDNYGNYEYEGIKTRIAMPIADRSLGEIVPTDSPRKKVLLNIENHIENSDVSKIIISLKNKNNFEKLFIKISNKGYTIFEKKSIGNKKYSKIGFEKLKEIIKRNIPQEGKGLLVRYIM